MPNMMDTDQSDDDSWTSCLTITVWHTDVIRLMVYSTKRYIQFAKLTFYLIHQSRLLIHEQSRTVKR